MLLIISITSFLSSTLAWYFSNNLQISTLPFLEAWWRAVQPNCNKNASIIHVHDVIEDVERKKERKKESKTPEAMEKWKWELPRVGFEPTTCTCACTLNYFRITRFLEKPKPHETSSRLASPVCSYMYCLIPIIIINHYFIKVFYCLRRSSLPLVSQYSDAFKSPKDRAFGHFMVCCYYIFMSVSVCLSICLSVCLYLCV